MLTITPVRILKSLVKEVALELPERVNLVLQIDKSLKRNHAPLPFGGHLEQVLLPLLKQPGSGLPSSLVSVGGHVRDCSLISPSWG